MTAEITGKDSLKPDLPRRVAQWSAVALAVMALATSLLHHSVSLGVVVGGGMMLGMLQVHRWMAPAILSPGRGRRGSALFWGAWLLKWPLLGGALYLSLRHGWASPLGVGLGLAIVPAVTTTLALPGLRGDAHTAGPQLEGGP